MRPVQFPGVAPMTPEQMRTRERAETVIRLIAPALNVLLAAGDRLSRIVAAEDHDYYPPRTQSTEPPPPAAGGAPGQRP